MLLHRRVEAGETVDAEARLGSDPAVPRDDELEGSTPKASKPRIRWARRASLPARADGAA